MSGSTARTGRLGKAVIEGTLVRRLTEWGVNPTSGESAWGDSDSEGYTNRLPTRKDCTGSIAGKFDEDEPIYDVFKAGDVVLLVLWQTTTAGDYWYFERVVITSFNLVYNQDTQEVVGWTSNWGADGRFYAPGEVGAPSATLPT